MNSTRKLRSQLKKFVRYIRSNKTNSSFEIRSRKAIYDSVINKKPTLSILVRLFRHHLPILFFIRERIPTLSRSTRSINVCQLYFLLLLKYLCASLFSRHLLSISFIFEIFLFFIFFPITFEKFYFLPTTPYLSIYISSYFCLLLYKSLHKKSPCSFQG
jgi:hypothetical protein